MDEDTPKSRASGFVKKLIATKKLQKGRIKKPSASLQGIINQQTLGSSQAQLEEEGRLLLSKANSWNDPDYYNASSVDEKKGMRNAVVQVLRIQKGTCSPLPPKTYKAWYPIVQNWTPTRKITPLMTKDVNSAK